MSKSAGILIAAFFAVIATVGLVEAVGERGDHYAQATFQHEGDDRAFFSVDCSSSSSNWTTLVSSDSTRRSALFLALADNSAGVCLSSGTDAGDCNDAKQSTEIYPGGSLTDYTVSAWSCRSRAGYQDTIKGYTTRHSRDNQLPGE